MAKEQERPSGEQQSGGERQRSRIAGAGAAEGKTPRVGRGRGAWRRGDDAAPGRRHYRPVLMRLARLAVARLLAAVACGKRQ
ncbi:hypothetical protein E2562_017802 [Oryza meyeriana var. granulata]|uniref:Uncharacterized protein n=1 Tax=Oryza meyeriana var. granulata TaxID=110450 RepID=A0A6G1BM49_9ORYZ|nr:hypothetical protein E2562_017802 [Oryza meyeriana var. granulata]